LTDAPVSFANDIDSPPDVVIDDADIRMSDDMQAVADATLSTHEGGAEIIKSLKAENRACHVTIRALRIRLAQLAEEVEAYRVDRISAQLVNEDRWVVEN
jgi:hypothetical protein